MGRGKLKMQLIEKEQSRWTTYQKRKKCLKKKAYEFSTLCNVDTCMIIYGPKPKDQTKQTAEIWPDHPGEVRRILEAYRAFDPRGVKTFDLSDYFLQRKKKIDDEISKVRRSKMAAKYPVTDRRLDQLSLDQIRAFVAMLDAHLELVKRRITTLRENQRSSESFPSHLSLLPAQESLFNRKKIEADAFHASKTVDTTQLHPYYLPDGVVSSDLNSIDNSRMMWMMNRGDQLAHFSGASNSTVPCKISFNVAMSYDQVTGLLDDSVSTSFRGPQMHQMLPYGQCSMMPIIPSQIHTGFQFEDFYQGINRHDKKTEDGF